MSRVGSRPKGCKGDQIGEKLRHFRLQRGLSQMELAEGICSTQLISAIERGTTNPRVQTLVKLADRLSVPLHEIYRPEEDEFPNRVKLELVEAYLKRGELEPAQMILDELQGAEDLVVVERQQWHLLQGETWNKAGKAKEAISLLQEMIDRVEQEQNADDELMCRVYNQLGTGYFKVRQFAKAYSAYKRGYQLAMRLPAFEMVGANVTYNLGIVCNQLELWDEAEVFLERAREYYESVSDLKYVADSYFELAIATKSEEFVEKALHLYEGLESMKMANVVRQFHAIYIEAKKDYRSAVGRLQIVASEFDRFHETGKSLFAIASTVMVCIENTDIELAQHHINLATNYKEEMKSNDPYDVALYYRAKAAVALELNDFDECLHYAQLSSDLYVRIELYSDSADSLEYVMDAYQHQGRHAEAYKVAKKANALLRQSRRYEG